MINMTSLEHEAAIAYEMASHQGDEHFEDVESFLDAAVGLLVDWGFSEQGSRAAIAVVHAIPEPGPCEGPATLAGHGPHSLVDGDHGTPESGPAPTIYCTECCWEPGQ